MSAKPDDDEFSRNIARLRQECWDIYQQRLKDEEAAKQPKVKVVTDQGRIVGKRAVDLHPNDPNWRGSGSRYVVIREDLAEIQRLDREQYQRYLRELDPVDAGIYSVRKFHRD